MDPITAAIIAALTAGVAGGVTTVGERAIVDGYEALKTSIKEKFGNESEIAKAVQELEKQPDSTARKAVLREELLTASAEQYPDLIQAAETLLAKIKDLPGGQTIVSQAVTGDRNIFSGTGDVTITNQPNE